ncbi:MAG: hypothetical protein JSS02_30365, partial [Planctomycetes bacterium]|nr:hypothetical protein [Planctomycetota bacterium]
MPHSPSKSPRACLRGQEIDLSLLREPHGADKKSRLHHGFKEAAPDIEAGVCPNHTAPTATSYPGMEIRFIQKQMPILSEGFVVHLEVFRQDEFQNDGIFNQTYRDAIVADCERFLQAPQAAMLFHAAFVQGITNFSSTAPHGN